MTTKFKIKSGSKNKKSSPINNIKHNSSSSELEILQKKANNSSHIKTLETIQMFKWKSISDRKKELFDNGLTDGKKSKDEINSNTNSSKNDSKTNVENNEPSDLMAQDQTKNDPLTDEDVINDSENEEELEDDLKDKDEVENITEDQFENSKSGKSARKTKFESLKSAMDNASSSIFSGFKSLKEGGVEAYTKVKDKISSGMKYLGNAAKEASKKLKPWTEKYQDYVKEKQKTWKGWLTFNAIKSVPVIGSIIKFVSQFAQSNKRFWNFDNFNENKDSANDSDFSEAIKFGAQKAFRGFVNSVGTTIKFAMGIVEDIVSLAGFGIGHVFKAFKGALGLIPAMVSALRGAYKKGKGTLHQDRIKQTRTIVETALGLNNSDSDDKNRAIEILNNIESGLGTDTGKLNQIVGTMTDDEKQTKVLGMNITRFVGEKGKDTRIQESSIYKSMDSKSGGESAGTFGDLDDVTDGELTEKIQDKILDATKKVLDKEN